MAEYKKDENLIDLGMSDIQMLNQLRCHVLIYGKKFGLKRPFNDVIPKEIIILNKYSRGSSEDYDRFLNEVNECLKDMVSDETFDYYRVIAKKDRFMVYLNQPSEYFEDSKTYNSFVRLRRDHLDKLGANDRVELCFDEYKKWSKMLNKP